MPKELHCLGREICGQFVLPYLITYVTLKPKFCAENEKETKIPRAQLNTRRSFDNSVRYFLFELPFVYGGGGGGGCTGGKGLLLCVSVYLSMYVFVSLSLSGCVSVRVSLPVCVFVCM